MPSRKANSPNGRPRCSAASPYLASPPRLTHLGDMYDIALIPVDRQHAPKLKTVNQNPTQDTDQAVTNSTFASPMHFTIHSLAHLPNNSIPHARGTTLCRYLSLGGFINPFSTLRLCAFFTLEFRACHIRTLVKKSLSLIAKQYHCRSPWALCGVRVPTAR